MTTEITRRPVWGRWLRLSHWSMTVAVLVLIFSGWLYRQFPQAGGWIMDLHYYAAALLIPALAVRIYLLFFGSGTDLLQSCKPDRHKLRQAWAVASSYLTLGKVPLPKWYAHNPLWGPVYLVLFVVLVLEVGSGLLLSNDMTLLAGISMRQLHVLGYWGILSFSILHIAAVFTHDTQGTGSDVSAMISGQRIFMVEKQTPPSHSINIVDIKKNTTSSPP